MPTITDSNVVLGKLRPQGFAGGKLALKPELARAAVEREVAGPLGMSSVEWAAAGVLEIGEEAMANAARVHAIEQGKDVTRYALMASGGAGPLHAVRIAEKLGISRVIIPTSAGVGSAVGFLSAPVAYEVARSLISAMSRIDLAQVGQLQAAMRAEARAVVEPALSADEAMSETWAAELRYAGQGHALRVLMAAPIGAEADLAALEGDFIAQYLETYGTTLEGNPVELVALSLICSGPAVAVVTAEAEAVPHEAQAEEMAQVFDPVRGSLVEAAVLQRATLAPGAFRPGPALVAEAQTTTWVPGGWQIRLHSLGHVILDRGL